MGLDVSNETMQHEETSWINASTGIAGPQELLNDIQEVSHQLRRRVNTLLEQVETGREENEKNFSKIPEKLDGLLEDVNTCHTVLTNKLGDLHRELDGKLEGSFNDIRDGLMEILRWLNRVAASLDGAALIITRTLQESFKEHDKSLLEMNLKLQDKILQLNSLLQTQEDAQILRLKIETQALSDKLLALERRQADRLEHIQFMLIEIQKPWWRRWFKR